MGQVVVNVGSYDLTSHNANTANGTLRTFDIPANAGITKCVATFATHVNTGNFQGKAFFFNGVQAHPNTPWPTSGIELNPALLSAGPNTFKVSIKSQAGLSARWSIGDIYLTIDYIEPESGGGGSSEIGALSVDKSSLVAGDTLTINLGAASSGIYRDIYIFLHPAMNGISTVVAAHGAEPGSWTIPIPQSWCTDYAPNSNSFSIRVYVIGYIAGGTVKGDAAKDIAVNVPATALPSIGALSVSRIANVPAAITGYVKGHSGVSLKITGAAGALGSTISAFRIECDGKIINAASGIIDILATPGVIPVTATITDSRGRTASATQTITVLDYSPPTILSPLVSRSTAAGVKSPAGTYIYAVGDLVFSPLAGQNIGKLWGRIYEKGTAPPAYAQITDPDGEWLSGGGNIAINHSYIVELKASDLITEYVYAVEIPTSRAHINAYPSEVGGLAFGGYAEEEDAVVIKFSKFKHKGDPVAIKRIGDWHISDDPTHPALLYGGVWEKLTQGVFLVAAGTGYTVGATGGEATHVITAAEMPYHTHLIWDLNWEVATGGAGSPVLGTAFGSKGSGSGYAGGNVAHNNMPPFRATNFWRRTA